MSKIPQLLFKKTLKLKKATRGHHKQQLRYDQINDDKGSVPFSFPKTFTVLHSALTLTPSDDFGRELEHTLQVRPHKPTTSADLTYALEAKWEQIPAARYQNVVLA